MTTKFPVIYEWGGKNYSGFAPDIPGCVATARTLPKIRVELRSALEAHLQWMLQDGDHIPLPSSETTVSMMGDPDFPNPPGYYVVVEWLEVSLPERKAKRTNRKHATDELAAA